MSGWIREKQKPAIFPNRSGSAVRKAARFARSYKEKDIDWYRGKHLSQKTRKYRKSTISIPVDSLREIPGESRLGLYNYETGEIEEL